MSHPQHTGNGATGSTDEARTLTGSKSISVAMCTYNGGKYIREQLDSIANQTRLPAELIICDDRSKDNTPDIINEFAATAPFPVKFSINPVNLGSSAKGISKNFAHACTLCSGELIVPCDQDDIWVPHKLASMAETMERDPGIGALFSDAQLVTDQGVPKGILLSETTGLTKQEQERLARGDALPLLMSMTKVYGSSLMFDAKLLPKILPLPPNWWFDAWVACVAAVHAKLVFTPESLYLYRIHATQSVSAKMPTLADRIKRWRSSAKEYWKASEPPLADLYAHLAAEQNPRMDPYMQYVRGRMDLLRFRAELPSNPVKRAVKIIPKMRNYHLYFNGWKSLVKDLTS
jgi:glycosyltransferase involved in cell wall biosynthesis